MFLELKMPEVGKMVRELTVERWLMEPAARVGPGDDVVDLMVDEITRMEHGAPPVSPTGAAGGSPATRSFDAVRYTVRVTAVDSGFLRSIESAPGRRIAVGDVLAILSTNPDEDLPDGDVGSATSFRVVANVVEDEA